MADTLLVSLRKDVVACVPAPAAAHLLQALLAVLIVNLALLVISEDLIGCKIRETVTAPLAVPCRSGLETPPAMQAVLPRRQRRTPHTRAP